jgi:hypothetical protein
VALFWQDVAMTSSSGSRDDEITITAAWPSTAHAGARVSNVHAFQWDKDRMGIYLMMGHVGLPIWLAPGDREIWEAEHPGYRIPVETLGAFYMNKLDAMTFCVKLAQHLGLVIEGVPPDAAS